MKNLFVISSFLLALSCEKRSSKCEQINFVSFSENERPMISILAEDKSSCGYEIDFNYCPNRELYINTTGKIHKAGNCLWVKLDKPLTKEFCLFDFNGSVGKLGEIKIEYIQNDLKIDSLIVKKTKVERIIEVSNDRIYVFRISEIHCYENNYLDVVYFVSPSNGILGSYISYLTEDREYYMFPKGNIFEEHIDYSKMKRGQLL